MNKFTKTFCGFILVLILFINLIGCNYNDTTAATYNKDNLIVHYLDVGQADSILIQINNKNLLIDGGNREDGDSIIKYLKKQGVEKLDYVVATHPHEDHIGGMAAVVKKFDIGKFYAPKKLSPTKTFENMVLALKEKNLKINEAKPGSSLNLGKNVECKILAPNSAEYDNLNNYSVVIKITYGNTKFLFNGDAHKLSEKEMLSKGYDLSADVLKVGHHGSSSSSSKEFLDKVNPKIAIISCGKNNDYGHPHKETLDELNKRKIKIYRTDKDGTIVLESDGKKIIKK